MKTVFLLAALRKSHLASRWIKHEIKQYKEAVVVIGLWFLQASRIVFMEEKHKANYKPYVIYSFLCN